MKMKYIYSAAIGLALGFTSCEDFLDTMPDNRAELNSDEKITAILVSAYPTHSSILLTEYGTDNVMDNGKAYNIYHYYPITEETYLWETSSESSGNDDPNSVWQGYYSAIAAANQALVAIEEQGNPERLAPQRAEALLCRAYGHFMLANVFCLPYNPQTASKDMGLPYASAPETKPEQTYERGTLEELYSKINADIEAALPYVDDRIYTVPKYHFNVKAAYAFAARFNLFYVKADKSNYNKVVEYATKALGASPASLTRQMIKYTAFGADDISNEYIRTSETANFLLLPAYSYTGRCMLGMEQRYNHARPICTNETYWATGPWGTGGSSGFYISTLYGGNQCVRFPKITEFWEETDKINGTGYPHIVHVAFSADETLLCRAEAYAFLKEYDKAAADLNIWQSGHCYASYRDNRGVLRYLPELTRERVNDFFTDIPYSPVEAIVNGESVGTIKKTLHPQGFMVEAGEQENFIQCVLHFRRLETLHDGSRWFDIKRYGIEVGHNRDGLSADILKVDDPRRAIQLPKDVIRGGLTPNPR